MVIKQYDIFLISLDPTIGHEIKKVRPCVVISPNEMNDNISTIIIAPMTTRSHSYPTRIPIKFEDKKGWVVLDQIRALDRKRFVKKLGKLNKETILKVKRVLQEMLVE
ncbi:MAG: type II toxin-antitoxin system PemK/MazF family toxin [Candidatus Caldatribacteriota bacterium]|jgi:mRNA interferase MazF|nr:type II toxin-antitoxin system PemK/MazF family toxin [Atribacterota bacterium]MDD3641589.1 type II toxin-antitoxin system PemK/MazF family toxin [Atribacterota bacterium]MDD4289521.1 type II toxin-antitoxin system PemK/MazF family toxin [Atribacterota bacterium]MDD4765731.1 type II toxin-antitoxin system PemK/MazF family toxin [Atribacterota bacterium]MDD5635770.1 type II toxin-antitoxin system PemK/MazF family toxin [Atribacterota bacterium]